MSMLKISRKALTTLAAGTIASGVVAGLALTSASAAPVAVPHYKVVTKDFTVLTGSQKNVTIKCPAGLKPVGGGAHVGQGSFPVVPPSEASIVQSDITLKHNGWEVTAFVSSIVGPTAFTADVVCIS